MQVIMKCGEFLRLLQQPERAWSHIEWKKINILRFKFRVFWPEKCLLLGGTVNLTKTLHEEMPCKVQPGPGPSPESHAI